MRITPLCLVGLFVTAGAWAQDTAPEAVEASAPVAPDSGEMFDRGMEWLSELLRVQVGENSFRQILVSFGLLLATLVVRRAVLVFLFSRLRSLAGRTTWKLDDRLVQVLEAPVSVFVLTVGVFLAVASLTLPPEVDAFVLRAFQATTLTVVFWGFLRLMDLVADALEGAAVQKNMAISAFIPLLKKAARVFLVVIGVILIIQNLGYSVGSLLAGLGIGGLAVALAAQESLGNFFGSVSIAADRSFKVGDWIQVGDTVDGEVEEIGLRSTKVRTWAKSQLTIPNKVLANEIIENWSRMPKRRIQQVVGVTYESTPEDLAVLVEDIRRLLREDPGVHQDVIMVHFSEFGDSSLDIDVLYFTVAIAAAEHREVRQRINLKIMRAVEARGLSMAYPTQTIYLERPAGRRPATRAEAAPPRE